MKKRELHPVAHAILMETAKSVVRSLAYAAADAANEHIERKYGRKAKGEREDA